MERWQNVQVRNSLKQTTNKQTITKSIATKFYYKIVNWDMEKGFLRMKQSFWPFNQ